MYADNGAWISTVRRAALSEMWPRNTRSRGSSSLPQRHVDVWRELATGDNSKVIAARLGISPETMKVYVSHSFTGDGCQNRVALALLWLRMQEARRHGLYLAWPGGGRVSKQFAISIIHPTARIAPPYPEFFNGVARILRSVRAKSGSPRRYRICAFGARIELGKVLASLDRRSIGRRRMEGPLASPLGR